MSPPTKRAIGSLTDLLGPKPADQPTAADPPPPSAGPAAPARSAPGATTAARRRTPQPAPAPAPAPPQDLQEPAHPGPGPTVRFTDLERKECRLREDQLTQLSVLSRRLQKSRPRGTGGERITDNTLIRVAVDVLLTHSDTLTGYTEQQIRDTALRTIGGH